MYSCEMYNGTGYPEGVKGNEIPIEAQITNILVRLCSKGKVSPAILKTITDTEASKYNPDLIAVLNDVKKDIKKI